MRISTNECSKCKCKACKNTCKHCDYCNDIGTKFENTNCQLFDTEYTLSVLEALIEVLKYENIQGSVALGPEWYEKYVLRFRPYRPGKDNPEDYLNDVIMINRDEIAECK